MREPLLGGRHGAERRRDGQPFPARSRAQRRPDEGRGPEGERGAGGGEIVPVAEDALRRMEVKLMEESVPDQEFRNVVLRLDQIELVEL